MDDDARTDTREMSPEEHERLRSRPAVPAYPATPETMGERACPARATGERIRRDRRHG